MGSLAGMEARDSPRFVVTGSRGPKHKYSVHICRETLEPRGRQRVRPIKVLDFVSIIVADCGILSEGDTSSTDGGVIVSDVSLRYLPFGLGKLVPLLPSSTWYETKLLMYL